MQNITKANAYLTSGRTVALVVGPMLGGLLISSGFYGFAFGIDATTYLFSAIMVWLITAEFHEKSTARQKVNFWDGLKQGYGFLFARMGLFSIILLRCLDAFGSSSLNVGLPVFVSGLGQFTPGICYGFMMLAYGIGEMTGAIFLAKSRLVRESHPEIVIGVTILFMAVSFGISMNVTNIFLGMFFIFFCGTFEGATVVTYNTALQKNPDEVRGRIVGFSEAGVWGSMGIGMFLSGLIMEHIDFGVIVQIFSAVIVAGSIFHIIFWRKKLLVNRIKEAADYV
ncbi:MAG: MFS transporter, partial [Deltaproteobacteria bacterium]|nr:MFS transporter [Deltaproteobacteria bacterium]